MFGATQGAGGGFWGDTGGGLFGEAGGGGGYDGGGSSAGAVTVLVALVAAVSPTARPVTSVPPAAARM